jgi:hypothetical protein
VVAKQDAQRWHAPVKNMIFHAVFFCKCKGQLFCENPFTAVINQTSDDYTDLSNDADNDGYSSAAEY